MTLLMIVELLVVLVALWVGARYGSLALGAISGIGLAILVFCFQLKPGNPPTDVIYIIIAAVTCAGMLQASGGMDWMIQIAERLLRKHPERITILAPFTTFFLTILVGTGHVVYTLMPIICDIALKKGIRPERPCGIASIASQIGITCSPIAAAVVAFSTISIEQGFHVSNVQVILLTIPACIIGILCAVIASWHRGLDLDKDPKFQARIADPAQREYIYGSTATTLDKKIAPEKARRVYLPRSPHLRGNHLCGKHDGHQSAAFISCRESCGWRDADRDEASGDEHRDSDYDDCSCGIDDYLLQGKA